MGNVSVLLKAALAAVLVAGLSGCTSASTEPSQSPTPVITPEPSPNPMATLNGLSVYVASTGVDIVDQTLVTGSRGFDVTIPDGVTQIGFAAMCESASQDWTVSANDDQLDWTSPGECATKAVYSDIIDVSPGDTVAVEVGLDGDTFLAIVTYAETS